MKMTNCVLFVFLFSIAMPVMADYLDAPALPSGVHIRPENRYFDVIPRIVPADQETTVEIIPLYEHVAFKEDCTYEVTYVPTERPVLRGNWIPGKKTPMVPDPDGRFRFTMYFAGEQEHVIHIVEIAKDNKQRVLANLRVYSLEEDLFALRPYKGDFHMHSHYSDGTESPAYVAGACRRVGLDFMGLSDHRLYRPSILAKEAYNDVPIDLRIYPAEEVHPPDNPVHILSFGASAGITEFYRDDESSYRAEVQEIMDNLHELPQGVNRYQYASCVWASNKIRELGGLSMLCHYFWFTSNKYYFDIPLLDHLIETEVFDALELISGFGEKSLDRTDVNNLQVARYHEERAKGRTLPICGISDCHGKEHNDVFGRYYTVCFSPSGELTDIIEAIKALRSVAVEAVGGQLPRAHGPFRLVKYTHFLLREIFPQHDELCFEEGRLMLQYAAGDKTAADRLRLLEGQTVRLYDKFWAKD